MAGFCAHPEGRGPRRSLLASEKVGNDAPYVTEIPFGDLAEVLSRRLSDATERQIPELLLFEDRQVGAVALASTSLCFQELRAIVPFKRAWDMRMGGAPTGLKWNLGPPPTRDLTERAGPLSPPWRGPPRDGIPTRSSSRRSGRVGPASSA